MKKLISLLEEKRKLYEDELKNYKNLGGDNHGTIMMYEGIITGYSLATATVKDSLFHEKKKKEWMYDKEAKSFHKNNPDTKLFYMNNPIYKGMPIVWTPWEKSIGFNAHYIYRE